MEGFLYLGFMLGCVALAVFMAIASPVPDLAVKSGGEAFLFLGMIGFLVSVGAYIPVLIYEMHHDVGHWATSEMGWLGRMSQVVSSIALVYAFFRGLPLIGVFLIYGVIIAIVVAIVRYVFSL
ncbi:hypothetical protein [Thioalkalivibrio sp. ALE14]|uniref:hypothetical protein n=1 Tax=Thioalkalivibrio sp. ALE14 TaxID=1158168 RepID=UPI00037CB588|nr:hypothetical protein [Thioalkalivibrio sp. ALE14]